MSQRKHLITLLVALLVSAGTAGSQEQSIKKKDIPQAILDAFHKSYPNAAIKGYSRETDKGNVVYEIESLEGKIHRDISYAADGSLVSTEESLAYAELPEPVRNAIEKDYPKAKVSICEKVVKGGTTNFELLVRSGKQKQELVFNADGTLVKQEKK